MGRRWRRRSGGDDRNEQTGGLRPDSDQYLAHPEGWVTGEFVVLANSIPYHCHATTPGDDPATSKQKNPSPQYFPNNPVS
jgi:hypothetical protein